MFGCIMGKIFIFIFVLVNFMAKEKSFTQPDGISITFSKEDLFTGRETFCFSSLFCLWNKNGVYLKYRNKTLFITLLMLCRDIEMQPGPSSLRRDEFQQQFVSSKRLKIILQIIRGILSNLQEFLLSDKNIDIAILSETHLSAKNLIDLVN